MRNIRTLLEKAQSKDIEVVVPPLIRLESATVAAVRFKEGRFPHLESFDDVLAAMDALRTRHLADDMSLALIEEAARIKSVYAASMVDCYLIANAIARNSEILTADREILDYMPARAKLRKLGKRFATVSWRSR
jgi:predicted nucleic acid-binding protein